MFALAVTILCAGCGMLQPGRVYTHTVRPHSLDFHDTPVGSRTCILDEYRVREPVSGYGMSVDWSQDRIRTAAQAAGITNVAYTEIETLSVFMGVYSRRRLIVHGD